MYKEEGEMQESEIVRDDPPDADDGGDAAEGEDLTIIDLIDMDNIASKLSNQKLRDIGSQCIDDYERDKGSRAHREDRIEQAMNLALQITKEKNFPWPKASNVILPIITGAALEFAARAYPAIVSDSGDVAKGVAVGDDSGQYKPVMGIDQKPIPDPKDKTRPAMEEVVPPGAKLARAGRIARHISYQLTEEEENWEADTDQLLHMLPIVGCMFRKRYWDPVEKRSRSEIVFPQRLIVNYGCRSLDDAPTVSEEVELFPYEITERIRSEVFLEFDYKSSNSKADPISDRERIDEAGEAGGDNENAPHLFIQQMCRIDLDDDGYPEPYIVTIHKDSQHVCRIVANYRADSIKTNAKKEIFRIVPESYYTKYGFIPAFDGGFYDLGFGELMLSLNLSINTLINQLIDAGTLANAGGGFIGSGLRLKGGALKIRIGEYKVVDSTGQKIAESVYQFNNREPSVVLFQLLGSLVDMSKDITGNKDILSGEQIANQPGIAALAHIEQGLTKFKAIYKRLHRSIKKELKIQYRLNSLHLTDIDYHNFCDGLPLKVAEDYRLGDCDIIPVSDPNAITSQQRLAKAQALDTYKDDPYVDGMEARRRIFTAMGVEDQDKILKTPQPKTDPTAEALMATAKAEMAKAQNYAERSKLDHMKAVMKSEFDKVNTMLKAEKTSAEIAEIITRSMLNIANAEAAEAGMQLGIYETAVKNLTPNNEGL